MVVFISLDAFGGARIMKTIFLFLKNVSQFEGILLPIHLHCLLYTNTKFATYLVLFTNCRALVNPVINETVFVKWRQMPTN